MLVQAIRSNKAARSRRDKPAPLATGGKMNNPIKEFGTVAQGLAKNPLGIIALFIVLIYGFACLVVGASSHLETGERTPIIWFMVIFLLLF